MTAPCPCPVLPSLDELTAPDLARIVGAPLRCVSCGEELELRCPQGHVHHAPKAISPNISRKAKALPPEKSRGAGAAPGRQVCVCGHTRKQHDYGVVCLAGECECTGFEPKNKPHVPKSNRAYKPKICACGATFTPTGPRAVRCPTCSGAIQ